MQKLKVKLVFLLTFVICGAISAQNIKVTGNVTDADTGIPIPGASVIEQGTNNGVAADFDGNYEITVASSASLVISSIGFVSQTISLNGRTTINVSLSPDVSQLDEVVVVGFGTQKKENVTGATSFVKMEEVLGDRPIVNAAQALQGTAPGLQVVSNSGQPGATGTSINVRGFTSITGGTPLVLINNVPGSINDINPRDIESVSVLKDAAASSIYGARAAFGVVLITTKSAGRNQAVKFAYDVTTSVSRAGEIPEKATTREFVEALDTFGENSYFAGQNVDQWVQFLDSYDSGGDGLSLVTDPISGVTYPIHYDEPSGQYYPLDESDIIGDFIDNFGYSTIHNFTVSGGSETIGYRLGTGYSFEDGVMVTNKDSFRKYTVNALVNADISPKLTSTSNVIFRSSIRSVPSAQYNQALQLRMYDPTGFFEDADGLVLPFASPGNLVRFVEPNKIDDDNLRLFQKLEYKPTDAISLTGEYTYEKNSIFQENINNGARFFSTFRFNPTTSAENAARSSSIRNSQTHRIYNGLNLYGKYRTSIAEKHNFEILLGVNRESEKQEFFSAFRNDLIDPTTPTFNLAVGEDFSITDSYFDWAVIGFFGRLNYNYKERYFIEGNLRYDGSSLFAEGDRFVLLPSVSAGWNLAKERFFENVDFVSLLKLRASWGEIGNQRATRINPDNGNIVRDYYPTIPGFEDFRTEWINLGTDLRYISFNPAQLISAGLTWETITSKNVGLDANFFDNRLTTTFDLFTRETSGMLIPGNPLPAVLGTDPPFENAADLETKGWEVQLGWQDRKGDFSYGVNINVWDNQSEITKYDNPGGLLGNHFNNTPDDNFYYVGMKPGEIWGYVTDGYYTVDDFVDGTLDADLAGPNRELRDGVPFIENAPAPYPGDIKYKDLNGDGFINSGNNTLITEVDAQGNPVRNANGAIDTGTGDRKIIGNTTRRYQFGINGNVGYKQFDFSFVLNGVGKRDLWRGTGPDLDLIFPFPGGFDHIYKHQLDFWTPENQNAFYPRIYGDASTGNTDSNYGRSRFVQTKYLSDESYLRVQNITFGYSLGQGVLDKLNIDKFRIFVSGNNLHTFDKLPKGMEPDQRNDGGRYPIMAQFTMGFNLSF
ncbi:SusC/RagA family TonB-linked outer membrane protein [Flagellimonas sp. 2504JD1-5]